jgi:hypothetical protein
MLSRESGGGLGRNRTIEQVRLRQNRRSGSDERLRQMDQRADSAMIAVRCVWDAGRIVLMRRGRYRPMIAVHVRMGLEMRDMRMIVIRCVEMDVARGYDELDQQRGDREARSPFLAQPEPAHRRTIPQADFCLPPGEKHS